MKIVCVASGSSGNCYIVSDGKNSIMLEAGVPPATVVRRAGSIPKSALITHEHNDHSKYVNEFEKFGVKIYASAGTLEAKECQGKAIESEIVYDIDGFFVQPFQADHDAIDPFCYFIESQTTGEILLFATDTYYIHRKANKITHYLIECNYDEERISEYADKTHINRVVESHLSLRNAIMYLKKTIQKEAREIYICHLSSENLDIKKAMGEIRQETGLPVYVCKKDGGYYDNI